MSKIYNMYLKLKEKDKEKLYLFHCGKFYIFIGSDADFVNQYMVLKKTKFTNEVDKCGFPENVLENYLEVFKNLNLNIEVIEKFDEDKDNQKIISKIKKLDLDSMTPKEALNKLYEFKKDLE